MTCVIALIPLFPFLGFLVNAIAWTSVCRRPCPAGSRRSRCWPSFAVVASRSSGSSPAWRRRSASSSRRSTPGSRRATSSLDLAFRVDPLSAVMILVITGIGSLIHIYSTAYMHEEVGQRVRALLLVPEPVRVVHAGAGARLELPGDVRRLGRRRPLLVPADRLLVQEEVGLRRRQEGVRRQPHRRLRVHPRHAARCSSAFGTLDFQRIASAVAPLAPEVDVRHRCRSRRCCCSSAPPASRRRFRSTSGCRTRWKARRRCRP